MERAAKQNGAVKVEAPAPARKSGPREKESALHDRFGNQGVLALLRAKRAQPTVATGAPAAQAMADRGVGGTASPLPFRDRIQESFGHHDVSGIEAYTGGAATEANAAFGARAYTNGGAIAFGGSPDLHTAAHEAAHVVQQRAGVHLKDGFGRAGDAHERNADAIADGVVRGESVEPMLDKYKAQASAGSGSERGVQFSLISTTAVAGAGDFRINMITQNAATPTANAGFDGWIQFTPTKGAPNSNTIGLWQIFQLVNVGGAAPGADTNVASVSPAASPRGALGQPGARTAANPATGVQGGFMTDVQHQISAPGTAVSPRFTFEPAAAGTTGTVGAQPGPPGRGTGGSFSAAGITPGYKRSDDPSDIKSTSLYDTPGFSQGADFEFQTVARGEDTQNNYGTIFWGFGTRNTGPGGAAVVVNEHSSVAGGATATFGEAIERHRDFYVHEPVTIYFEFDHDNITAAEEAKITGLAGYLTRNPAVQMTLDGFADVIGPGAYNVDLSQRRVRSVQRNIAGHFPTATVVISGGAPAGGHGISTAATDATSQQPAGTSDQPGASAAVGGNQNREANRQFNRRVVITFSHPAGTGPAAPGGVGNPAPAAPPVPAAP